MTWKDLNLFMETLCHFTKGIHRLVLIIAEPTPSSGGRTLVPSTSLALTGREHSWCPAHCGVYTPDLGELNTG